MLPKCSTSIEGRRHHSLLKVRLLRAQNTLRSGHPDRDFCFQLQLMAQVFNFFISGPFHGNWRDIRGFFFNLKWKKNIQTSLFHHIEPIHSIENWFLYKKMPMLSPKDLLIDQELTSNLKRAVVTDVTQRSSQNYCVNFPFVSLWIYWHLIYGSYIFYSFDYPTKRIAH